MTTLERLAKIARQAGDIARNKTAATRRAEEAERSIARMAWMEDLVEGERRARELFWYERFKG